MPEALSLEFFSQQIGTILDVRSPAEYQKGHIPNSFSLPLFNDEERSLIGTVYKQKSRTAAIDLALQLVGPKLYTLVKSAQLYTKQSPAKILCWRGGMRSGFVARLLESIGMNVITLLGGYRSFRRWALKTLDHLNSLKKPRLLVIGGLTGTGKTAILKALHAIGEQIVDLEWLACHRGSSFGHIGLTSQPSQEQFENELAFLWNQMDLSKPIWIEDESRLIGKCHLPSPLYQLIRTAPLFYIDCPQDKRLQRLCEIYGTASSHILIEATQRISKRLGSQLTQKVIDLIDQCQRKEAFRLLLTYYDKAYYHQIKKRHQSIHVLEESSFNDEDWAKHLKTISHPFTL